MEFRVIARGALAGAVAGLAGFAFYRVFVVSLINAAIDYESGREDMLNALRKAAGMATEAMDPTVFSRDVQTTVGAATGIVGISLAFGLLLSIAYLILQRKFPDIRPRTLIWAIAGFGFAGIYLLPYIKYPANPPAIGHDFTVQDRGMLYLILVGVSLVLLGAAVFAAVTLKPRLGTTGAIAASAVGFLVLYGLAIDLMPSLGDLAANVQMSHTLGYARAATETPQPIMNTLGKTLTVDGHAYGAGQIAFPGFDADLLWKFRWYALLNQVLVWGSLGLIFGSMVTRLVARRSEQPPVPPVAQVADRS